MKKLIISACLLFTSAAFAGARVDLTINMPADNGAPTGTLFEGANWGAGFAFSQNTMQTSNPRVVTFFARGAGGVTTTNLGKPFDDDGATFSLVMMGSDLIAAPFRPRERKPRRYDTTTGTWRDLAMPGWTPETMFGSMTVINGQPLYLYVNSPHLYYAGSPVAGDNRFKGMEGYSLSYAKGKLYLYFTNPAGGPAFVYICNWSPGQSAVRGCIDTGFGRDVYPYVMFPKDNGVVITDNMGFVQELSNGGAWTTHRSANGTSFQIYSALYYSDKLWLGQYPSGNLMPVSGSPPMDPPVGKDACSDSYGREAQSLAIHMGNAVTGVWPFGEIWSGVPGRPWHLLADLFPYPEPCGREPFKDQALAAGQVYNGLGQRVFGLASWGTGLAASTSLKGLSGVPALTQLTAAQRAPYGSAFLIEQDYELSCQVPGSGRMKLSFMLTAKTMEIRKGHTLLCSRPIDRESLQSLAGSVKIGDGTWGAFVGTIDKINVSRKQH